MRQLIIDRYFPWRRALEEGVKGTARSRSQETGRRERRGEAQRGRKGEGVHRRFRRLRRRQQDSNSIQGDKGVWDTVPTQQIPQEGKQGEEVESQDENPGGVGG